MLVGSVTLVGSVAWPGDGPARRGGAHVRVDLEALLEPATTVVLTQECQRGVVGPHSSLPELAAAAAESGMLAAVGRLVRGARAAGGTVLHAVAARPADGKGASHNARVFRAAGRGPRQ